MASNHSRPSMFGQVKRATVYSCVTLPPDVNSPGVGGYFNGGHGHDNKFNLLHYSMPSLELQIFAIFLISQSSHFVLKRLGVPIFISHLIAGLVIGPMAAELIHRSEESIQVLGPVSALGYAFFMFQSGVKMNIGMVKRAGKMATYIGVLSVLVPLLAGSIALQFVNEEAETFYKNSSFLLTVTYSLTSFPVIANLLSHLKIINSELGRLVLSSAAVGDLLSLFLFASTAFLKIGIEVHRQLAQEEIVLSAIYVLVVLFVLRPAMMWVVKHTPEGRPVKDIHIYAVILAFLMTIYASKYFGQILILGPFIFGLAVPDGPPLGSALVEKFDCMVSGLFLPLFVATCGMRMQFGFTSNLIRLHIIVFLVTMLTKFLVSLLLTLLCKMPKRDASAFALIISAKGVVEMGWYGYLSDNMLMPHDVYAFLIMAILYLACQVPVLVKWLYDPSRKYAGYRKRNIMNSKLNSELQMLACIHVPNNVTAVINLLDASCPTGERPLAVNVLHLIKLSGQASPIFISHQTEQKTLSNNSYSGNVITSFQQFERNNWGAVSINAFTAISPTNLMYEDICTLALDTLTSVIVLPFHRRWYTDGSIESDDHAIMTLNWNVLERAPCSVGILIDRGHLRHPTELLSSSESSHKIAMIFFGGNDDREALTFAKRMAQDTRVKLTVRYLYATNQGGDDTSTWNHMLDSEVIRDIKDNGYVRYIEEEVNDGHVTASILRGMVNEYDLIIVGRRYEVDTPQTSGLEEWSEFPELGVIGDLLASADFFGKCSVLVVQQQQTT